MEGDLLFDGDSSLDFDDFSLSSPQSPPYSPIYDFVTNEETAKSTNMQDELIDLVNNNSGGPLTSGAIPVCNHAMADVPIAPVPTNTLASLSQTTEGNTSSISTASNAATEIANANSRGEEEIRRDLIGTYGMLPTKTAKYLTLIRDEDMFEGWSEAAVAAFTNLTHEMEIQGTDLSLILEELCPSLRNLKEWGMVTSFEAIHLSEYALRKTFPIPDYQGINTLLNVTESSTMNILFKSPFFEKMVYNKGPPEQAEKCYPTALPWDPEEEVRVYDIILFAVRVHMASKAIALYHEAVSSFNNATIDELYHASKALLSKCYTLGPFLSFIQPELGYADTFKIDKQINWFSSLKLLVATLCQSRHNELGANNAYFAKNYLEFKSRLDLKENVSKVVEYTLYNRSCSDRMVNMHLLNEVLQQMPRLQEEIFAAPEIESSDVPMDERRITDLRLFLLFIVSLINFGAQVGHNMYREYHKDAAICTPDQAMTRLGMYKLDDAGKEVSTVMDMWYTAAHCSHAGHTNITTGHLINNMANLLGYPPKVLTNAVQQKIVALQSKSTSPLLDLLAIKKITETDHLLLVAAVIFYSYNLQIIHKWDPLFLDLLNIPGLNIMDAILAARFARFQSALTQLLPLVNDSRGTATVTSKQRQQFLKVLNPCETIQHGPYKATLFTSEQFGYKQRAIKTSIENLYKSWQVFNNNGSIDPSFAQDQDKLKEFKYYKSFWPIESVQVLQASFQTMLFAIHNEVNARKRLNNEVANAQAQKVARSLVQEPPRLMQLERLADDNTAVSPLTDNTAADAENSSRKRRTPTNNYNNNSALSTRAMPIGRNGVTTRDWDTRNLQAPISYQEILRAKDHPNPYPNSRVLMLQLTHNGERHPLTLALMDYTQQTIMLVAEAAVRVLLASTNNRNNMSCRELRISALDNMPLPPANVTEHFQQLQGAITVHYDQIPMELRMADDIEQTFLNYLEHYWKFRVINAHANDDADVTDISELITITIIGTPCIPLDDVTAREIHRDANRELTPTVMIVNGEGNLIPNIEATNNFRPPESPTFTSLLADICYPKLDISTTRTIAPFSRRYKLVLAVIQGLNLMTIGMVLIDDSDIDPVTTNDVLELNRRNLAVRDRDLPGGTSETIYITSLAHHIDRRGRYTSNGVNRLFFMFANPFEEPILIEERIHHINNDYAARTNHLFEPLQQYLPSHVTARPLYNFETMTRLLLEYISYLSIEMRLPARNEFQALQYNANFHRYKHNLPIRTHRTDLDDDSLDILLLFQQPTTDIDGEINIIES